MGKPSPSKMNLDGDSVSLHSQPGRPYYDNDAPELSLPEQHDDLPPLYDEAAEASTSLNAPLLSEPTVGSDLAILQPFRREEHITYYLDSTLDTDPEFLEQHVRAWAATPPRPFVCIKGYHQEQRSNRDGKREAKHITDFDVKIELTPYFFPDGRATRSNYELSTAENGDKTKRGTVFRKRANATDNSGRIELGMAEKPSLTQWCHMYCASHSGLKVFQLKRCLAGFDDERLRSHLDSLVRRLNYRGNVQITFPVQNEMVEVWNDCRTNQWRLTKWIYVVFCVSMLWLLAWPYLFIRTKRFETVKSIWNYSRVEEGGQKKYTTISEDQWYNLWGRAISKAVLSKRQGTLDQQDLLAAAAEAPATFDTGNSTVDGALGLVVAGVNAMNEVNRTLGWGENQY
ncbi:hypothetical protein N0V93_001589 [Gnomoniopsis smithogilvyi]|uniref:Abc transporter protein n=1 Tax=Gnomoniopsis smithogilvyi TaxID=1191159 RepID=A0A9W8Z5T7_9PEZI|nr:hypothetical protein N0V93_001589 [Gnomoniopsis smithogilvyi]